MNAEFNTNITKLDRDMMHFAEERRTLPREQYQSRENHQSITVFLKKCLTYDVLQKKRLAGAIIPNDAEKCYNRVAHNIAIVSMIKQGAPRNVVKFMFQTLQKATHYIMTVFGRGKKSYKVIFFI